MVNKVVMKDKKSEHDLEAMRHTAAHLLAAAVKDLWPGTHNAIGPAIEDGFYQDFDFGERKISQDDFPKIEKRMNELLKTWGPFEERNVSADEARQLFANNPYKLELIEDFARDGKSISVNDPGNFLDLCKGGHAENPQQELKYFKLLSLAGAYWRGNEKNKMLTRIYGTAFSSQEDLEQHLHQLEEAKKRDHKILGPQLGIFMFHETSPGMPYWLPKGMAVLNELIDFWRKEHAARGYHEISSPLINKKELWETSGHWEHYKDDMFVADMGEHEIYGIKPMNCPNAMIVFGSDVRSYKDLPLRLSDTDLLHRYERSGTLNGLLRVRSFRQDDSHNFITEDQIEQEYGEILDIAGRFYGIFKLDYRLRLGTRPEKFLGDEATWDRAEAALKNILDAKVGKDKYEIAERDGAFYGPKIDILMKDALHREWQMGTIQLDFQQPRRFKLAYTDTDGQKKTPVVIHRVIYGSLDRFIGLLIEHYAGAFPLWLSPVQVAVLPISDQQIEYATNVVQQLKEVGVRVELDDRSESIGKKIRAAETQKVPVMVIVGKKEVEAGTVAVRSRAKGDEGAKRIADFITDLQEQIKSKQ